MNPLPAFMTTRARACGWHVIHQTQQHRPEQYLYFMTSECAHQDHTDMTLAVWIIDEVNLT